MSTQSKCQIALKFSTTDTELKNEPFLAEEYDHGDDGEREKEIEKMTENLMENPIHIVTKTVNENNKKGMMSKYLGRYQYLNREVPDKAEMYAAVQK